MLNVGCRPRLILGGLGLIAASVSLAAAVAAEKKPKKPKLPDHLTPESPPPIFLTSRPDLGDVSQGEVLSIKNYYRIMKGILTPVQMEGLRLLLTPFPQQQFNQTEPYHHDGRLLTLEDTVEFFNLVLELRLTGEEKEALTAFMRCL